MSSSDSSAGSSFFSSSLAAAGAAAVSATATGAAATANLLGSYIVQFNINKPLQQNMLNEITHMTRKSNIP